MATNFCTNCGAKLRVGAKFCGSCGEKIPLEDEKLPPMPYEKSKSVMEVYAEKKAEAQIQAKSAIKLEKALPAPQTQPKSVAEVFAEQKKIAQAQVARENLINVYNKTKNPPQATPPPCSENPTPQESLRPTYTPLSEYTLPYKEDVTIKEKFFSTQGRLNRQRYFNRTLLVIFAQIILMGIISAICSTPWGDVTRSGEALIGMVGVAALIPKYCLDVRRLKDIGKAFPGTKAKDCTESTVQLGAAMYAVLGLINMYFLNNWDPDSRIPMPGHAKAISSMATGFWLWMQCKSGMVGANKFGEDPLANERRMNL